MNFESESLKAGNLLLQALDRDRWQSAVTQQYLQMQPGTKQPEIKITGSIKSIEQIPKAQLLIRHRSLPLAEILRQMNIYSNNKMSQMLADLVGGANMVAETSARDSWLSDYRNQVNQRFGFGRRKSYISPCCLPNANRDRSPITTILL